MNREKTLTILCLWLGATVFAQGQSQVRPVSPKAVEATDSSTAVGSQSIQASGTSGSGPRQLPAELNPLAAKTTSAPVALGAGDLLSISVYDTPELAAQVRVNSQGNVTFQPVGEVHLGGLTPEDAGAAVGKALSSGEFVKHPRVSVFVLEYANQTVSVTGEVAHPGIYPLMGSYRLADLLSAAGGLTARGGNDITVTHRAAPDSPVALHLGKLSSGFGSNPVIQPGDAIYVPQAGVAYVVGEVTRPGGFLLDRDTTLTAIQAIALAQGTTQVAAKSRVRVVRTAENGQKTMILLDLKKVYEGKMSDILLQKDDILYVPPSTLRIFTSQAFLQAAAASAAGASVYRW